MSITLYLPWPPSVNAYWRAFQGRVIVSKQGRDYQKLCRSDIMAQGFAGRRMDDRLAVEISLYPPSRQKRDVDNHVKAVLDQLVRNSVIVDDELIDHLVIDRCEIRRRGQVVVTVGQWKNC